MICFRTALHRELSLSLANAVNTAPKMFADNNFNVRQLFYTYALSVSASQSDRLVDRLLVSLRTNRETESSRKVLVIRQ